MLVLTRKVNQSIMIGDQIKVIVVDVRGDQVRSDRRTKGD